MATRPGRRRGEVRGACATAAVLLLAALALSGGCAGPTEPVAPSTGASNGVTTVSPLPEPRLEARSDGTAVAYGWVSHADLEGGFWRLTDHAPDSDALRQGRTVVVLLPGDVSESQIALLDGAFVEARGRMTGGVSIRMSGPEMTVDALEALQEP